MLALFILGLYLLTEAAAPWWMFALFGIACLLED